MTGMGNRLALAFAACLAYASASGGASQQSAARSADFVRLTPEQIHWQDMPGGHGAQLATIAGDPAGNGLYVQVIVQVVGIGPADTVQADPAQPFWVQLPP